MHRAALALFLLAIMPLRLGAEENAAVPELPPLRSAYPFGTTVGRTELRDYRSLFSAWLAERVGSGSWVVDVARDLPFAWRLDDEWERASAVASARPSDKSGPSIEWFRERAWVYGRLPPGKNEAGEDLARRILWNVQSLYAGSASLGAELTVVENSSDGERSRFLFDWQRVLPPPAGEQRLPQLFRERLRLIEPGALSGMAWLTFRFLGSEEDLLWTWSKAIQKTRQLTSANRADDLLTTHLTLDDLLGWGGKMEAIQPVFLGSVVQVAPFWPFLVPLEVDEAAGCLRVRPTNEVLQRSDGLWNLHTRRFENAAPWLPTAAVYVPRDLWMIELQPRDPFSAYGRQVVYVDRLSHLPVVKLVYARDGTFAKIVVSVFGLAATSDHRRKLPFPLAEFEARHLGPAPAATNTPLPAQSQVVEMQE